jgi:predicted amidohydrolase
VRLALLQMRAAPGDATANLATIEAAAREAAAGGAGALLVPELAVTGYGAGAMIAATAGGADGAHAGALGAIAVAHGLTVVAGLAERAGDALYNTALVSGPGGSRARYRKRHLYGAYERALFTPGEEAPWPFDLGGVRAGLLVCYDIEFPECARALAVAGAALILAPTALPASGHAEFIAQKMIPVRAFENQVFVAYANHAGADDRFAYAGQSVIAAPDGAELARADARAPALLFADIDPGAYAASRAENAYLADRRAGFPV